jgi:hypothetical protein
VFFFGVHDEIGIVSPNFRQSRGAPAMHLFPPTIDIGDTEGFSPAKDIFGRATLGKGLTNLVGSVSDPLVIAVDGQWGSGKTTFLKMWAGELRKEGFPVIYFDAFVHDYVDDAFSAIAGEIIGVVKEQKKLKTPTGKRFAEGALKVSKVIARAGVKIGAKAATLGALDGSEFANVATDVSSAMADAADNYLGRILGGRKEERDAIEAFRKALSDLPALLTPENSMEKASPKPLVFILDELDRCRPPFALAVLERMKHFFSVQNVHFILGMHVKQIHSSIAVTYGSKINANLYLQKFIQLYFFLYEKADNDRERTASKFLNYLRRVMEFAPGDDTDSIVEMVSDVAIREDLNLRAIERIMTTVAIALTYTPKNYLRLPPILAGLAILKVVDPEKFKKAKRGTLTMEDVRKLFAFGTVDERERFSREWFEKWWDYALNGNDPEGRHSSALFNYNFGSPKSLIPVIANDVIDRFSPR